MAKRAELAGSALGSPIGNPPLCRCLLHFRQQSQMHHSRQFSAKTTILAGTSGKPRAMIVSGQATILCVGVWFTMAGEFCHSFTTFAAGCCEKRINARNCASSVRHAEKSTRAKAESPGRSAQDDLPKRCPFCGFAAKCHNCAIAAATACSASCLKSGRGGTRGRTRTDKPCGGGF